jgi:hypothetical protein
LLNVQVFTSSGTYTPTNGATKLMVRVLGSGGAGGGSVATGSTQLSYGSGGGAGGYVEAFITSGITSQTVTIGAGGTGASGTTGGTGGTTSFGSLIVCAGGAGGNSSPTESSGSVIGGGTGGSATVSGSNVVTIVKLSGAAANSWQSTTYTQGLTGGPGAASQLAQGGYGNGANGNGEVGQGYGSGGSGSVSGPSNGAFAGGAGSPGIIIIQEYI